MHYTVVGLGNPGPEYEHTRHNIGRLVVEEIGRRVLVTDWRDDRTLRARVAQGVTAAGVTIVCLLPDNFMNRSGGSVAPRIKTIQDAEHLVVVHDDIDLPLGTIKIVFDRGAGGHRGVSSIERSLKTRRFVRVRVGLLPLSPTGKLRKPKGAEAVQTFILKRLAKREFEALLPMIARAADAVLAVVHEGREAAMQVYNGQ